MDRGAGSRLGVGSVRFTTYDLRFTTLQDLLEKPISLISNFDQLSGLLSTYGPSSLQELRRANLDRFNKVGIPTHKDEEFKYTSLRDMAAIDFKPAYGATVYREDLRGVALSKLEGPTLTFVNGEFAPELSNELGLPDGVLLLSLQDALEQVPDQVLGHLTKIASLDGKLGSTNDERFVWLSNAFLSEGAYLYLPRGVVVETPIHLQFLSAAEHGPFAAHPRVLIVAEENAQAKIVESYSGLKGTYFNNCVTEIWLGESSNVEHTRYQSETADSFHIGTVAAHQEGNSTWASHNVSFGSKVSRIDVNLWINGEHTESWLNGVYTGADEQVLDNHTRIDHAKPNCHSFEVYKGILADKAVGVFNGKIFVYEDAQKTDAKQTNQALLLSPTATINTKPQLEIFADDVKCTHGATVGQLREDALFYLRARGIPEHQARNILVYAFAAEVLEKITVEPVAKALEKELFEKLQKVVSKE